MKILFPQAFIFILFLATEWLLNLPEELIILICGIIGVTVGIIHYFDYIKETKAKGVSIALFSVSAWSAALLAFQNYYKLNYRIASFFAILFGAFVFGFLNYLMQNQPRIHAKLFDLIFGWIERKLKKAGTEKK